MPVANSGKVGLVKECAALLRGGSGEGNTAAILQTLDRLKTVKVTPNVLRKTEVGKLINSKSLLHHPDLDVRQRSSALVASWRAIVKEATATGTGLSAGKRAPTTPAGSVQGGAAAAGSGAVGGEPPSRRRRLSGAAAPPSRAASVGRASVGGGGAEAFSPGPAAPPGAGPAPAAPPGSAAAQPPIPYETTGGIKHAAPSGPTPGPVPRTAPGPAALTNRYAPEGAGATVSAVQGRAGGLIKDEDEKDPHLAASSSAYGFGMPSMGPPSGIAPDGEAAPPTKPGKNPRVSLVSIFNECVPYPSERPGSGGRRGGKGYFCYENFHTGNCSRGDQCPFPHIGNEQNE